VGVNSRLDTIQAAVLIPKLAVLDEEIALRQDVAVRYTRLLNASNINATPYVESNNVSAWAQYTVLISNRDLVQKRLAVKGVPTAVHYPIPLNKQPAVADTFAFLPVGDAVASEVMSLPIYPLLEQSLQASVVSKLTEAVN
jgi:UDP-2-acetamido-2-deoxy-ribo-hexuluronate aminotransferase